jgi:hypothetical protein
METFTPFLPALRESYVGNMKKGGILERHQVIASECVGSWERRFCDMSFCTQSVLYVQRSGEDPELWKVAVNPGETVWLVAACDPICPFCGGNLSRLATDPLAFEM